MGLIRNFAIILKTVIKLSIKSSCATIFFPLFLFFFFLTPGIEESFEAWDNLLSVFRFEGNRRKLIKRRRVMESNTIIGDDLDV